MAAQREQPTRNRTRRDRYHTYDSCLLDCLSPSRGNPTRVRFSCEGGSWVTLPLCPDRKVFFIFSLTAFICQTYTCSCISTLGLIRLDLPSQCDDSRLKEGRK